MKYHSRPKTSHSREHEKLFTSPLAALLGALALFKRVEVVAAATVEYDLTLARQEMNVAGQPVEAMTINGQLPGPTLRFTEGDHAVIRVHNRMDVESSVHWHGILLPNAMDGVPFVTYPPIAPGQSFTYEFDLRQSGTYWYHSHTTLQEQRGLFGSLVISPKDPGEFDHLRDHVVVLSDWTDEDARSVLHTLKRGSEWYSIRKGSGQSLLGAARLGLLGACFRVAVPASSGAERSPRTGGRTIGAVVFGSNQGLVGQFNEIVAEYAMDAIAARAGKPQFWAVGERVHARLADAGLPLMGVFALPTSMTGITPLVGQILLERERDRDQNEDTELHLFYNRPTSGAGYGPVGVTLLPLDEVWRNTLAEVPWPTGNLPEVRGGTETLRALVREYLFVSLFRACAESLASENASRLAAMQRADTNIEELLEHLNRTFHRLRQSAIDEELFDVMSGFEALSSSER